MRRIVLMSLMLSFAIQPASLARSRKSPETVAAGQVASVVDGDTVRLESGSQIRLTGIQAPTLPLGRRGFRTWPLSKEFLERLTLNRAVSLRYDGRRIDRQGRLLAHLYDNKNRWVQGEIIARGMAPINSPPVRDGVPCRRWALCPG